MAAEAEKNEENTRRLKYSEPTDGEDDKKDNDDEVDFMDMPQVCKELQREPTGTLTPIDTYREEESRVNDAL